MCVAPKVIMLCPTHSFCLTSVLSLNSAGKSLGGFVLQLIYKCRFKLKCLLLMSILDVLHPTPRVRVGGSGSNSLAPVSFVYRFSRIIIKASFALVGILGSWWLTPGLVLILYVA